MTDRYQRLQKILKIHSRLLIAFSGGLDSGFLLHTAVATLGPANVVAVIGESPSYATGERDSAVDFARGIGLPAGNLEIIATGELDNPKYRNNGLDRCFHCKSDLYKRLRDIAERREIATVADGFNASDKSDFRPGHKAAQNLKIISPLAEAGLTKDDIRALAKSFNLTLADKPASACLASRIPFGVAITPEKLSQVDQAEYGLKQLGLSGLRVRHHDTVARIELPADQIGKMSDPELRSKISAIVKAAGFAYVTVDLDGYRMGSFNPTKEKGHTHG